jgi:hypothetical protein
MIPVAAIDTIKGEAPPTSRAPEITPSRRTLPNHRGRCRISPGDFGAALSQGGARDGAAGPLSTRRLRPPSAPLRPA